MLDSIIIGAGPAGLSAAIYLLRSNLKVAIAEGNMPGGQVANTALVENYPGYESIDGVELATKLYLHATNLGVEYISEMAQKIEKNDKGFLVHFSDSAVQAKTLIVATGMKHRVLGAKGEDRFTGKGVSWCAICDGSLYRGKDVAVVGGGNSALEESLYLSGIVNRVYLIHRRSEFRGDPMLVDRVKSVPNIELVLSDEIEEMIGRDYLESLLLKSGRTIKVEALFEYVGFLPNSELLTDFGVLDESGFIITDGNCETKVEGLFAAGDIVAKNIRQIVTAVNDGAIAALNVARCCR